MRHATARTPPILERYRVIEELARGRTTRVVSAERRGVNDFRRTVAIKVLADPDNTAAAADLVAEANLAARVEHPGVVEILDLVTWDAQPFLVMELVRGITLAELLAATRALAAGVPTDVVLALGCALADAVHHIHEARGATGEPLRIVHRNLEPNNILIGSGGWIKILDFGAACAKGRPPRQLSPAEVGRYTAPEVWAGRGAEATADVFSLGVALRDLVAACEDESRELHRIVAAACERDHRARPATARELHIALESYAWRRGGIPSPIRVARFMSSLRERALARASNPRVPTAPIPGLREAQEKRSSSKPDEEGRTRIRLTRRTFPVRL